MGERLCPFGQQCVRIGCLDLGLSRGHGVEQARPGYAFEIARGFLTGVAADSALGFTPLLASVLCPKRHAKLSAMIAFGALVFCVLQFDYGGVAR